MISAGISAGPPGEGWFACVDGLALKALPLRRQNNGPGGPCLSWPASTSSAWKPDDLESRLGACAALVTAPRLLVRFVEGGHREEQQQPEEAL